MKCGHLSTKDGTNAGSGRSCVAGLAKSWPFVIGDRSEAPAVNFGNKFHQAYQGLPKLQRFLGSLSTRFS